MLLFSTFNVFHPYVEMKKEMQPGSYYGYCTPSYNNVAILEEVFVLLSMPEKRDVLKGGNKRIKTRVLISSVGG